MPRIRRGFVYLSIILIAVLPALASRPVFSEAKSENNDAQDKVVAFRDVRLFDGEKSVGRTCVLVAEGKILDIGPEVQIPDGAEVFGGDNLTLLPGLIDSHTHVASPEALKQALVFGVTTEIDMFMDHRMAAGIKKALAEGRGSDMADLVSPGTLVTAPRGHGTQYGLAIPTTESPEDAQQFVDDRIAEGSDFIKIIYEDGSALGMDFNCLSNETLAAVIAAAHKRSKLAVVHITTHKFALDALEAGADGLAHIYADAVNDPDFGRFVAERGAFVIPTLTVVQSLDGIAGGATLLDDPNLGRLLSAADAMQLKRTFSPVADAARSRYVFSEQAVSALKEAGVPILAGTDATNPGTLHGASLHRELELLVHAGLTPEEALASATSVPARVFSLDDRGRIAEGKRADLLLVKGDLTKDVLATRNIVGVWKCGVRLDTGPYMANVERLNAEVERLRQAPPSKGSESGLISDFESGDKKAEFGFGWMASTDTIMGGKSVSDIDLAEPGAGGSKFALRIRGSVVQEAAIAWAGALFCPGLYPMAPANLSGWKTISFAAKGEGRDYSIMVFARSLGYIPARRPFKAGPEWSKVAFDIADFDGIEGYDIMGIFFGSETLGEYELLIDDVRLK